MSEKHKPPEYLKVVLPSALRAELDAAAAASGLSLAAEIRERISRTLRQDTVDRRTAEFASKVVWLAEQIKHDKDLDCHGHPRAFEAFAEAVNAALDRLKPAELTGAAADLFPWGDDDPKTLGRSIERHYERWAETMAKDERELKQLMRKGRKS